MEKSVVTVQNAEGEPETTAEILVQNKINYVPKVSVVIPVYNVEKYLRECLDSVVGQTLREIEIICVDDGSTDNSLEILKEYAANDKRIMVMTQKNLYAGVARNAGLAVAKGEYLSFLDSDDFFELDMLEKMYQKARDNGADICVCGAYTYNNRTQKNTESKYCLDTQNLPTVTFSLDNLSENPYAWTSMCAWNKIFRRQFVLVEKIRFQNLQSCNDAYFTITSLSLAQRICFCPQIFVHYRHNTSSSISAHRERTNHSIINVYVDAKKTIAAKKSQLLLFLAQRLYVHIEAEWRLCTTEQKQYFKSKAKYLLGEDYTFFAKIFLDTYIKKYKLFGFIPLLKIEEK